TDGLRHTAHRVTDGYAQVDCAGDGSRAGVPQTPVTKVAARGSTSDSLEVINAIVLGGLRG
ncbi:hypothetical protein B1218_37555, partial [Pseudomonas ogarae]